MVSSKHKLQVMVTCTTACRSIRHELSKKPPFMLLYHAPVNLLPSHVSPILLGVSNGISFSEMVTVVVCFLGTAR